MEPRSPTPVTKHGHPKALGMLFFAEAWERFSYYGMRALLVFYMTKQFHFGDKRAYAVYGTYTALVYATPLIGGILADRILGYRKAVVLGGALMALGHLAMAIEDQKVFYLALALLICGNGFFKPNISTIVGRLYAPGDDERRDRGFAIFYMGINLGALLQIVAAWAGQTWGYHYGFTLAGIGMLIGLGVFLWGQKLLAGAADPPDPARLRRSLLPLIDYERAIYLGVLFAILFAWWLVQHGEFVGQALSFLGVGISVFIIGYAFRLHDKQARDRLLVAFVLIVFSTVFWAFFEQAGSSMNLFTDRNVDRTIFSYEIPAAVFQSVNPAFILLLTLPVSFLWAKLYALGREPSTPLKFGLGIIQLGLGFGALYFGAASSKETGIVPLIWLVLGYLFHTTGELCLSPVGLSMITKLSPAKIGGLMMGTWFLSSAFAQYVAGLIAMLTGVSGEGEAASRVPPPSETVMVYGDVFGGIALVALVVGVLLSLVSGILSKRMHGVH